MNKKTPGMPNRRNSHAYRLNLLKRCGPMMSARMSIGCHRLHFTRSGLQKNTSQNKLPMRSNHTQTLAFRGRGWDRLCRCPRGGGQRRPAQRRAWSGRAEMRNGHITCVRQASSISICPCGRNLPDTSFVPLYLQACHGGPFPPAICKQTTRRSTHSSAQ